MYPGQGVKGEQRSGIGDDILICLCIHTTRYTLGGGANVQWRRPSTHRVCDSKVGNAVRETDGRATHTPPRKEMCVCIHGNRLLSEWAPALKTEHGKGLMRTFICHER